MINLAFDYFRKPLKCLRSTIELNEAIFYLKRIFNVAAQCCIINKK